MPGSPAPLRVELWDWDMVGKNDFLGMVSTPSPDTLHGSPLPSRGKEKGDGLYLLGSGMIGMKAVSTGSLTWPG